MMEQINLPEYNQTKSRLIQLRQGSPLKVVGIAIV